MCFILCVNGHAETWRSSTLTQLPSEHTLYGCFLTVSVVASLLWTNLLFTLCSTTWRTDRARLRLVSNEEVTRRAGRQGPMCVLFMFELQHPDRGWKHELSEHKDCHSTSKGDPYFIYEYAAWSFLKFNKEIWFTNLFLICVTDNTSLLLYANCYCDIVKKQQPPRVKCAKSCTSSNIQ